MFHCHIEDRQLISARTTQMSHPRHHDDCGGLQDIKPSAAIKNSSHAAANRTHGIVFAYREHYPLRVLGPWPLRGKVLPGTAEGGDRM